VIGQLLSFIIVSVFFPLSPINIWMAFIAFRVFDIFKPWPIRTIEHALETRSTFYTISVVVDDVIAGIFSGILTCILYNIYSHQFS
jgi:phosphatidylglycerophosphatase A